MTRKPPLVLVANAQHRANAAAAAHRRAAHARRPEQYNTPVPRRVRQDTSHGYGVNLGRPTTDPHSGGAILRMDEIAFCPWPGCLYKAERRRVYRHWRENHR